MAQSSENGGKTPDKRTFEDPEAMPAGPEDPGASPPLRPGSPEEIARSAADAARETHHDEAGPTDADAPTLEEADAAEPAGSRIPAVGRGSRSTAVEDAEPVGADADADAEAEVNDAGPIGTGMAGAGIAGAGMAGADLGTVGAGGTGALPPERADDTPRATGRTPRAEAPRGGVWPLLLGGALAAALGGTAVWLALQQQAGPLEPDPAVMERLAAQEAAVGEIEAALQQVTAALEGGVDQSSLEALRAESASGIEAIRADSTTQLEGLAGSMREMVARLDAVEAGLTEATERLGALETRPVADPEATQETIQSGLDEAYRQLEAEVAVMRARLDEATEAAQADIAAAEARAAALQAEAEAAARAASTRTALGEIARALETGEPFAEPLAALEALWEAPVPEALVAAAEEGVPTLSALQGSFAPAAREALAESTREEAGEEVLGRIGAFIRVQSGYRSLAEREGEDADAVLSQAEARLRAGDLAEAVAALEALPEPGQAAMAEWVAEAERRLAALQAAGALDPEAPAADAPPATPQTPAAPAEPAADAPPAAETADQPAGAAPSTEPADAPAPAPAEAPADAAGEPQPGAAAPGDTAPAAQN